MNRREVPRPILLLEASVPDADLYAWVIQARPIAVIRTPLGLYRQPKVECGDVIRPEVELVLDFDLSFGDQAKGLESLGQLILRIRLLRPRDAKVTTRPEARGFLQFFTLAAASLR